MRVFGLVFVTLFGCQDQLPADGCAEAPAGAYTSSFSEFSGTCGPLLVDYASPHEPAAWLE